MVKIGRCTSCGSHIKEIGKEKENCDRCGGPVDHIEVDMGPVTYVPRALNIGGLILIVIGVILLIAAPAGRNGDDGNSIATLVLVISAVVLFIFSLIVQLAIFREAARKRESVKVKAKTTRIGAEDGRSGSRVGRKLHK
jgi:hypothetical protein